jgi:hypothetical protein
MCVCVRVVAKAGGEPVNESVIVSVNESVIMSVNESEIVSVNESERDCDCE